MCPKIGWKCFGNNTKCKIEEPHSIDVRWSFSVKFQGSDQSKVEMSTGFFELVLFKYVGYNVGTNSFVAKFSKTYFLALVV